MKMLSTPVVAESRHSRVHAHLLEGAEVRRRAAEQCLDEIVAAADLLCDAYRAGGKVLLCGNGGSAADCQHVAAELVGRLSRDFERPGLAAIALTTDGSLMTAQANDQGFDGVFERQVGALGRLGDVLIGITTSGTSRNVLRALDAARTAGMGTIVLTGAAGRLTAHADVVVAIPSDNTQHVQEMHLAVEHALCELVERELFGSLSRAEGTA
jgi:D-sedoheptulose 7-phosphate isomerase